jgi:hypothetical protein
MRALLFLSVLAACAGDKPAGVDDCTKATYDPCTTEHDCANFVCLPFMDEGYMICTQSCDTGNPCPADSSGHAGTCTNGVCKPAAPNDCQL